MHVIGENIIQFHNLDKPKMSCTVHSLDVGDNPYIAVQIRLQ